MVHNPTRVAGSAPPRRQRRLDPRAGTKASDIRARSGPRAATIKDINNRIETTRGWKVMIFEGPDFEMVLEYMCSRNTTGVIVNEEQDRALRVLAGEIFLTIDGNISRLRAGDSYALEAGNEYQLSTSGTDDAEVIFSQGPGYDGNVEEVSGEVSTNSEMHLPLPQEVAGGISKVSGNQAKLASEIANYHKGRRAANQKKLQSNPETAKTPGVVRTPPPSRVLPGQQQMGVNPRPIGAGGFTDE